MIWRRTFRALRHSCLMLALLAFVPRAEAEDISLKISAGKNWYSWGDYILGQDLKSGFERLGYSVSPAYMDDFYPASSQNAPIDVYMHGFIPFNPPLNPDKTNVLYLYYPLETANTEKFINLKNIDEPAWMSLQTELWDFQLIAVASPTYQKKIDKLGLKTIFVPQFTNPEKFFYEYAPEAAYDILFVGRPGYERISAKWAMESGFDVALFGEGWERQAPPEMVKGTYIDNRELHKYYASAKIVLNDTRPDMKEKGFISNRVFDVTASGGFLISDYMPEIEQFYGDSIPMFRTKEELKQLLDYYLAHPEERSKKAKQAQDITLKNFTNAAAAQKIMQALPQTAAPMLKKTKDKTPDYRKLALKCPWPADATDVGEHWLAKDLAEGLKQNGFEVENYYFSQDFYEDDFYNDAGNLLYMQFKYNRTGFEDEHKNRIIYLYFPTEIPDTAKFKNTRDTFRYNTDISLNDELQYFDVIATPAKALIPALQKAGHKAVFVPQFTNPYKFKPEFDAEAASDLLFVGSPWYERISVTYAVESGYDIDVYGLNWHGIIPDKHIKGNYINNNELNRYYSSAKIVLSDHPDDLAEMGLVINRLYDASAAGAFVISEYSPYIAEIFGDSIPMFKNKEEFKTLVDFYLAHPEARKQKAEQAREITLQGYTNLAVGKRLKQIFDEIGRSKQ